VLCRLVGRLQAAKCKESGENTLQSFVLCKVTGRQPICKSQYVNLCQPTYKALQIADCSYLAERVKSGKVIMYTGTIARMAENNSTLFARSLWFNFIVPPLHGFCV
jgi:hypothetical protein